MNRKEHKEREKWLEQMNLFDIANEFLREIVSYAKTGVNKQEVTDHSGYSSLSLAETITFFERLGKHRVNLLQHLAPPTHAIDLYREADRFARKLTENQETFRNSYLEKELMASGEKVIFLECRTQDNADSLVYLAMRDDNSIIFSNYGKRIIAGVSLYDKSAIFESLKVLSDIRITQSGLLN